MRFSPVQYRIDANPFIPCGIQLKTTKSLHGGWISVIRVFSNPSFVLWSRSCFSITIRRRSFRVISLNSSSFRGFAGKKKQQISQTKRAKAWDVAQGISSWYFSENSTIPDPHAKQHRRETTSLGDVLQTIETYLSWLCGAVFFVKDPRLYSMGVLPTPCKQFPKRNSQKFLTKSNFSTCWNAFD